MTDFDCLIIDEAHHAAAKTYQSLNKKAWNNIYYRFFLTATFYRNQKNEQLLFEGIAGQLIHTLTIKDAVAKKYIVPIEAYYVELPKIPCAGYTWAQVYNELVVNREDRNMLIAQLLIDLERLEKPTLCLIKEVAHGNNLSKLSEVAFANGQDETTRAFIALFNEGVIKSLIGTNGILGEGVDTKPCEFVIIAGLGKAKSAFLQQIGRAVRNYPGKESAKIILIKDPSHRFTLRHFNEQKKILFDELGIKPVKLDI
jgi:superfamily II DNA or RNA helicase